MLKNKTFEIYMVLWSSFKITAHVEIVNGA